MKGKSYGIVLLIFLALLSSACRKEASVPEDLPVLLRIEAKEVGKEEAAVYGIQVKKEFEQIGGQDIWEFESFSGGKSAYEVAKLKVLENLIRVKILVAKAKERRVELTEAEKAEIALQAKQFFEDEALQAASSETIRQETVSRVFEEFELGQKLKREMLASFQPKEEMTLAKLEANKAYQEMKKENPYESHEKYVIDIAEIAADKENEALIAELYNAMEKSQGLTDELSQSMVYQENVYGKKDLTELFGEGIAEQLREEEWLLLQDEEGKVYFLLHLKEIRLLETQELQKKLAQREAKEAELRRQAEEQIREESFEVIFQEWKKEFDIRIEEKAWQEYVVFSLKE